MREFTDVYKVGGSSSTAASKGPWPGSMGDETGPAGTEATETINSDQRDHTESTALGKYGIEPRNRSDMDGNCQNPPSPTPQRFIWKRLIVGIVMFAFSIFLLAGLPQSLFDMIAATPEARRWAVVIAGSLGLVALFSSIFDINIRAAASIPGLSDSSAETVGATAFFLLFVLGGVMFFPELKDDGKVDDQIDRAIVRAMQALTLEEALLNGMRPFQIVAQIVTGNDPGRVADELQKNRKDGAWVLIEGQTETRVRGHIP